jgi:bifunctional enzyme CysN/CysC
MSAPTSAVLETIPAIYEASPLVPAVFPRDQERETSRSGAVHSTTGGATTSTTAAAAVEPPRFHLVVVGHVDHGKSTFVGRLLADTDSLPDGKLAQVQRACAAENMDFEYAFLLDALLEEQEQNITIDTTRIHFATPRRDYAIIDAPGHREFLKNMVTGAASASAALLLIDAREGIQDQTRRHAFLLSLLGVKQLAVLVNKMDLADYSEKRFYDIVAEYTAFLATLGLTPEHFIPITARHGGNITRRETEKMPWWTGPTVVEALDSFKDETLPDDQPLRLPLQDVYRWDDRRVFAGRLESGKIAVGDKITFSPGNKTATVAGIERWTLCREEVQGCADIEATAGDSIGITLGEQIFVERGAVAHHADTPPYVAQTLNARIFWLGKDPLLSQRTYKLRLATQETTCTITQIKRVIDAATLDSVTTSTAAAGALNAAAGTTARQLQVGRHEVADIELRAAKPLAFDSGEHAAPLGRFVILDNRQIAGGGVILVDKTEAARLRADLHPTTGKIDKRHREARNGHPGAVVWLTGLSGSGKSTIAAELERQLFNQGRQVYWLDGDNLRLGLSHDLGFSEKDRAENIRRAGELARHFADAGTILILSLISPSNASRNAVRERVEHGRFIEVFINAPLNVCAERDPKGLYAKAIAGEIKDFTGISAPYEKPDKAELELRTDLLSVDECVAKILEQIAGIQYDSTDWVI